MGMASLIISIIAGICLLLTFIIAGIIETNTYGGMDESSSEAQMIGLSLIFFLFVDFAALGLGIWGICKKNSNKLLAILGTCFSGATILIVVLLLLIGIAMAA